MSTNTKETTTQRVERLKQEKNPWQTLDEVRPLLRRGMDAVPPEWRDTYLRWWGVYTQGDGAGVIGGQGGMGRSAPWFMLRIRLTGGQLTAAQLRTIAGVARSARDLADITVRQNIQLHWIAPEDLPDVLDALWSAGLTTKGSCGDDTRNITGCPLAGIDGEEIVDASALANALTERLVGTDAFYNLPRKFKISISGCRQWCSYPEINDLGFTALAPAHAGGEIGFALRVGGGLSTEPHLAVPLGIFVPPGQVLDVAEAAAAIFRDADVLREHREKARLKQLFLRHGWTAARFAAEIERRTGITFRRIEHDPAPAPVYRDHVGLHPQKQPGLCYAGISVLRGRLSGSQLLAAADAAERFGSGRLRTTNMQNLLVLDVPRESSTQLLAALAASGLHTAASSFGRGAVACTGTEFCKLAITETKSFTRWLVEELDRRLPGFQQHLRLNVTGCPNSCGQHWIADIGIEGKKIRAGSLLIDAYYFCIGGGLGENAALARPIGFRCPAPEVPDAIERLLRNYLHFRQEGEELRVFLSRHSDEELRFFLGAASGEIAERDPSPGRVPHTVES